MSDGRDSGLETRDSGDEARAGEDFECLATTDQLPDGGLIGVTRSDGTPVCLFNNHGTIGAVYDVCTHAEFAMSDGVLHGDGTIECVWHGARFDCRSGRVCKGPAVDPLPTYAVRIEGDQILVGPMNR